MRITLPKAAAVYGLRQAYGTVYVGPTVRRAAAESVSALWVGRSGCS